jgi:hypothetical protein
MRLFEHIQTISAGLSAGFLTGSGRCALIDVHAYEYMHSIITRFDIIAFYRQSLMLTTERHFKQRILHKLTLANPNSGNSCLNPLPSIQNIGKSYCSPLRNFNAWGTLPSVAHLQNQHLIRHSPEPSDSYPVDRHTAEDQMMFSPLVVTTLVSDSRYDERR